MEDDSDYKSIHSRAGHDDPGSSIAVSEVLDGDDILLEEGGGSRTIGVTGAVFLILNKMIGTGSSSPSPRLLSPYHLESN